METIPKILIPLCPRAGSVWLWEPEKLHARELLVVIDVRYENDDVWVMSQKLERKGITWWGTSIPAIKNELSRWVQATVHLAESIDELNHTH